MTINNKKVALIKKIKIKEKTQKPSAPRSLPDKEGQPPKEKELFRAEGQLAVDVYETNSDFVVLTAIAGVSARDIDISIEKDMLIIKGNRQNPQKSEQKNYFYQECYWGPFSRKIILPEDVDISDSVAELDNGVLTIKFPKISKKNF